MDDLKWIRMVYETTHINPRLESKYGVFSGPHFPVVSPNTRKYGADKTSYLDTFHSVMILRRMLKMHQYSFRIASKIIIHVT